jgi:hypothetical protein
VTRKPRGKHSLNLKLRENKVAVDAEHVPEDEVDSQRRGPDQQGDAHEPRHPTAQIHHGTLSETGLDQDPLN